MRENIEDSMSQEELVEEKYASCIPEGIEQLEQPSPYLKDYIIYINTEGLEINYKTEEFQEGINEMSKKCGMITALINCGITPDMAFSYFIEKETMEYNLKLAEMKNKTDIECAKNIEANNEKNVI